ncbi:MAG: carboxypeptidase-like regulatory domain-containing protein [Thermodesulfobacteriota bacterium]
MRQAWRAAVVLVAVVTALSSGAAAQPPAGTGTVSGQLMAEGQPLAEGVIAFFNLATGPAPDQGTVRRIPDGVAVVAQGRFTIQLPPGRYHLGALARPVAAGPGPPRPGEKFYFARDGEGRLRILEVLVTGLEAGDIPVQLATGFAERGETFAVQGRVLDEEGKPLPGVVILVKKQLNTPRPDFASDPTAADGSFSLHLPAPGPYYLLAREHLGIGRPLSGSRIGIFGGAEPAQVQGAAGATVPGIEIRAAKVPEPGADRPEVITDPAKAEEKREEKLRQREQVMPFGGSAP